MAASPLLQNESKPAGLLANRGPGRTPPDAAEHRRSFWRMLACVWPHRRALGCGIVLGLFVAMTYAASLGGMLPVLKVIVEKESLHAWLIETARARSADWYSPLLSWAATLFPSGASPADRMTSLYMILGVLLVVNLVGNALRVWSQYFVLYACQRVVMDIRRRMYRKALRMPITDLLGDVSNRVSHFMTDVREVFLGLATLFGKVAREPLKAVCLLIVALWMDARLTLVALAIVPPAIGVFWFVGRKIRKATTRLLEGYGFMLGALEESLQGVDTVKTYGRENSERLRMWQLERRMLKPQLRLMWMEALTSPVIEVAGLVAASAGIVWLADRTFTGEIEPSRFLTMVILLAAMLDPIRKVANVYNMVQRSGSAATRIFEFLDAPEEPDPPRPARLPAVAGHGRAVSFEDVVYRYPGQRDAALNGVSLEVAPGECIAVVGPNGSGKSTLVKLLPRLLTPERGRVRLDGVDVAQVRLKTLRDEITVVTQRPVIFGRSTLENLAYGKPDATREEVRTAARRAFAADFIENWPNTYDTRLGEYGTSISGGQRQRIAIARAFLKPSTVLIFDEATSEIDAESEAKIHDALFELRRGKTTFLVAHRHTVMDMADRIVVMDAGKLVDFGRHEELLTRCPLYVGLYRSPAGG